jgi:hypothetical protein
MAMDSDTAFTKATVILEKPSQWETWLFLRRSKADQNDLWEYCDPDLPDETTSKLQAPNEPQLSEYADTPPARAAQHPDSLTPMRLHELPEDRQKSFMYDYKRYEHKLAEYKVQKKALASLSSEIASTVASSQVFHIFDCHDARSRLVKLKKVFAPSDATRDRELLAKYKALQQTQRGKQIEAWLDSWLQVTGLARKARLAEMNGHRAQEDFLIAIQPLAPEYATTLHSQLIIQENSDGLFLPIEDYINNFRTYWRRVRPVQASLGAFGTLTATLQDPNPGNMKTQDSKRKSFVPKLNEEGNPKCICDDWHWYSTCPYLIESARPSGWTPKKEVVEKIKAARKKNPKLDKRIKGVLKAATEENNSASTAEIPTSWDAGSAPSSHNTYAIQASFSADSSGSEGPYLMNRWIMDPGSNCHVSNSTAFGWTETEQAAPTDIVYAGGQAMPVSAWGEISLNITSPLGVKKIKLTHVAYVKGFFANILGLSRCKAQQIHFDSGRDLLYQGHPSNVICYLEYSKGHWLIDAPENERLPLQAYATYLTHATKRYPRPSYDPRKPIEATPETAHRLLGHPGQKAVQKLAENVVGFKLLKGDPPSWKQCDCCIQSKMTKQISRRPSPPSDRPFYRIGLDLVQLRPQGEECINGDKYALHGVCQHCSYHMVHTLKSKSRAVVMPALKAFLAMVERQFNYIVVVLRIDNDSAYTQELYDWGRELGLKIEPRAENTEEQSGLPERAGKSIIITSRALRIQANLPKKLTNELVTTSVYLLNRTPIERNGWKTPFEMVTGKKPSIAHCFEIGSKAFALNVHVKRGDKLESRTLIGYLVGYDSSNIYRVWMPTKDQILRTRDVVFKPGERFEGLDGVPTGLAAEEIIEVLDIPETEDFSDELVEHLHQPLDDTVTATNPNEADTPQFTSHEIEDEIQQQLEQQLDKEAEKQLLTPSTSRTTTQSPPTVVGLSDEENNSIRERTPLPLRPSYSSPRMTRGGRSRGQPRGSQTNATPSTQDETSSRRRAWRGHVEPDSEGYIPDRLQNNAPRRTDPEIGSNNIISEPRNRRAAHAAYHAAFAACLDEDISKKTDKPSKLHRDQIPPPPKSYKKLKGHVFESEFWTAIKAEMGTCWAKLCFSLTDATVATADAEILPLMWVFTYKFDEDGFVYKFKARLVVRGDLQKHEGDTYAATLAARVFRALMALVAAFSLLGFQYDALNAFLNAKLIRKLYVRTPEGFEDEYGQLLLLCRALYGLKEAPLLWYQELHGTLTKMGLKPVPGVPCLYTNKHLIVFFYVDDIVVLVHPSNLHKKDEFEELLLSKYELRKLGSIKWFLGIRVLRDPLTHSISLIQDSFIDKVAAKYNLKQHNVRYPDVPLTVNHLDQSTDYPDLPRTKRYQELVGSLAYISICTRPDISRAHSILARHPGKLHLEAAIHAWRYLIGKRNWAIRASGEIVKHDVSVKGEPDFFGAADAAFGDEPETRRSSQGFVFKLYGMPIDWKATVQRCVTKSTTEAELIALSLAGSEMEWWNRFFEHVGFDPEITPTLWCDNQQTVSLVTKEAEKLQTKLKHVDIHQSWLRQEVTDGRLEVKWKETALMPADGFTKSLPRQKHDEFMRQLGLVDVKKALTRDGSSHSSEVLAPEPSSHWY